LTKRIAPLIALWLFASFVLAEPQPTAAMLARVREAAGGDALGALETSRAKLRIETQGLRGTGERIDDHRTGRSVERWDLGVIRLAEGFDGEAPWTIEGNNPVRRERGADAMAGAFSAAHRRTLSHLTQRRAGEIEALGERTEGARRFSLLRITPEAGRAFELWLDAKTFLPDRVVEKTPTDTITTTFRDWRRVDGVAFPFALRESNGDAKYDTLITVESLALGGTLADAEFAPPAPPRPDFGIAGNARSASVPFELANNNIFLEVKLAGRAVTLLCDTGGLNIVTPELARELGIAVTGQLEGRGVGEKKVDVGVAQIARMEIGDAFLENQTFYVFPLDELAAVEGRPAPGVVGYEVFRRFVTRIDYDQQRLTLHDPARFSYQGPGAQVPIAFDDHTPRIEAELDGIRGWFDVDTGSRSSVTLAAPFVKAHDLAAKYGARFTATMGWGVGGPSRGQPVRPRSLRIASFDVRDPVADLSVQQAGSFAATDIAGNIGGGVLKRFDLVLDYANERIFFEPNSWFRARDVYDRSGLWLNDAGDALRVMDVTPGGPGESAGIRAGELVRAIDTEAVGAGDLLRLRARFREEPPGTSLRLELESPDGARRSVTLELVELI